jgi:hypothetical protein
MGAPKLQVEPLVLHDEEGQELIVPVQHTDEGAPYYNLSPLRDGDETCVVFVREDGFTFSTNTLNRRKTAKGKEYTYWGKNQWFATRIKQNSKDLISVNVFRRSSSGNLQNITRMTVLTPFDMPRIIREAYALCFQAAYLRAVGTQPLGFTEVAADFISDTRYNALQYFVRAYAYPAAHDAEQQRLAAGFAKRAEMSEYAREVEEYFKEPTWARAMQKLFGKHLPEEVATALSPVNVNSQVLEGAYVVRSLVAPKDLLRYPVPSHRIYEKAPLGDMRRALRAMPEANRAALLKAWREDRLVVGAFISNVRGQAVNRILRMHMKPLPLGDLTQVHTWGQLTEVFLKAYNAELEAIVDQQRDTVDELRELIQNSFTSLPEDNIELVNGYNESWGLIAMDMYNTRLALIEESSGAAQRYANFHMKVFLWNRPFAHGSPLNTFHRKLQAAAPKTSGKRQVLQIRAEVALPLMRELIASLDSLLRRYGVPRTPRNRTRLLVAAEVFYNTKFRHRQPKMGKNFYAMIASDYALPAVYEAHIMGMGPQEYPEFEVLPDAVRAGMTKYNRATEETDWF